MGKRKAVLFKIGFHEYSADAVAAVKQLDSTTVEVRYLNGRKPVRIMDTTSSQVLAAIDKAKADADSA